MLQIENVYRKCLSLVTTCSARAHATGGGGRTKRDYGAEVNRGVSIRRALVPAVKVVTRQREVHHSLERILRHATHRSVNVFDLIGTTRMNSKEKASACPQKQ